MSSLIVAVEIFWFCLGGTVLIYNSSRRASEAISQGIVIAFILFSLLFQVSFLLKVPNLSFFGEILIAIAILFLIKRRKSKLFSLLSRIKSFLIDHKLITSIILICWLYLFLLAVIIPPANYDSMTYNLARIFLFQQENTLFLKNVTTLRQATFVVGTDILSHGFLRFYSDYGIGLFSFLAYISIGFGTYALSRNYASVKNSLLTTLVIIGMPELCFQATSTKNDIFTAVAALFCLISIYRLLEKLNIQDLSLLILGLFFGFSAKLIFFLFLAPFIIFFGYLIIRKYNIFKIFQVINKNWLYLISLIFPVLLMSQFWLFFYNHNTFNDVTGNASIGNFAQPSSLLGLIANCVRYLFQNFDLFPFDYIVNSILKIDLNYYLIYLYDSIFKPIFGNEKLNYSLQDLPIAFTILTIPNEETSWYGLAGTFLIIPALIFSFVKGRSFLKMLSITLISFILIISYIFSWSPYNCRYVTLFFTSSGACVAFLLEAISRKGNKKMIGFILSFSVFILISSCLLNATKNIRKPNIWIETGFGNDRLYYAREQYIDERVEQFNKIVPIGSKVALSAGDEAWIYHFYLTNPQTKIEPVNLPALKDSITLLKYDYLLCLDVECKVSDLNIPYQVLWSSTNKSRISGKIIKINQINSELIEE